MEPCLGPPSRILGLRQPPWPRQKAHCYLCYLSRTQALLLTLTSSNARNLPSGDGMGLSTQVLNCRSNCVRPSRKTCSRELPLTKNIVTNKLFPSLAHDTE